MRTDLPTDDLDRLVAAGGHYPVSHRRRLFLGLIGLVVFALLGVGVCQQFSARHHAVDPTTHVVPVPPAP